MTANLASGVNELDSAWRASRVTSDLDASIATPETLPGHTGSDVARWASAARASDVTPEDTPF